MLRDFKFVVAQGFWPDLSRKRGRPSNADSPPVLVKWKSVKPSPYVDVWYSQVATDSAMQILF